MLFNRKRDKSIDMSMPTERELYGVRIVKLPVARYIKVLNTLETLPQILASIVLPDGGAEDLLTSLANGNKGFLEQLFTGLLVSAPTEICKLLSDLLGIPLNRMLDEDSNDPLSPAELIEILLAFWKKNDMTSFFGNVRKLRMMLSARTKTATTGSSAGSP